MNNYDLVILSFAYLVIILGFFYLGGKFLLKGNNCKRKIFFIISGLIASISYSLTLDSVLNIEKVQCNCSCFFQSVFCLLKHINGINLVFCSCQFFISAFLVSIVLTKLSETPEIIFGDKVNVNDTELTNKKIRELKALLKTILNILETKK